ncbi:MAG: anthranilate synthase component II [Solirubrobacterales bacterium]
MLLVLDNYDSFVYNLVHGFERLGQIVEIRRNDAVTAASVAKMAPDYLVISPGPGRPEQAGACLEILSEMVQTIPILGVCLGHQAIARLFGGRVIKSRQPTHGKAHLIEHDRQGVFRKIPSPLKAARYHSLTVDEVGFPQDLIITARTASGEIMGLRHRTLPIEGVQFHPESILTEHGLTLMQNFLEGPRHDR